MSKKYIPVTKQKIGLLEKYHGVRSILEGRFTEDRYVEAFSNALKEFDGHKYCKLCNSGSSANLLALTAMSYLYPESRGKYVVTCTTGFPTTINPIIQAGYKALFVDVNTETLNAYTKDVMNCLERDDVAGYILAHTLGFPYDEYSLATFAKSLGKFSIADCCDALGSTIKSENNIEVLAGTYSDIVTHSFYPAHHISCGEGGAVLTSNARLSKIINSLANWGKDCWCKPGEDNACGQRFSKRFGDLPEGYDHKYVYTRLGYNLKMTETQAAIGFAQMQKLPEFIYERKRNFSYLSNGLILEKIDNLITTYPAPASPFGFPILLTNYNASYVGQKLEYFGVGTRPLFCGNAVKHPVYKYRASKSDIARYTSSFPHADRILKSLIWVGCHPSLKRKDLDYMVDTISMVLRSA